MDNEVANVLAAAIREQTKATKELTAKINRLDETIQMNNSYHQDTQSGMMSLITVLEKAAP